MQILKTYNGAHGKLSLVRVLSGALKDGAVLHRRDGGDARVGGMFALKGEAQTKLAEAKAGDTVALGRLEGAATGETLSSGEGAAPKIEIEQLTPVYGLAIETTDRKDEVKLTAAIAKLREEDPSLHFEQNAELQEMALAGQGEIHLEGRRRKTAEQIRAENHHASAARALQGNDPQTGAQHGRHKRQSGGHGQFGDVHIEIKPAAARHGLRLRGSDQGRRGAEATSFRRSKRAWSII